MHSSRARFVALATLLVLPVSPVLSACGSDGSGKAAPPTQSNTVEVPFQITTVYALEQKGDTDPIARARYYDVTQVLDIWGNAGTIALSPGDAAYADGKQLDIETRTETLGTLRVDYSQTIPKGKPSYLFELRRPKESISATIPAPDAFAVKATEYSPGVVRIDWAPVKKNAKISVLLAALNGCALFEKGALVNTVDDTGTYTWTAETYRSPSQDCEFEIQVERRFRTTAPATWKKGTTSLPTNGVNVEHLRTEVTPFTLKQRT